MPRHPRLIVPGQPHHLVQRGNNRMIVFDDAEDFDKCLSLLHSASQRHRCSIHAYVVMNNHLHLLATPEDHDGPAGFMQSFGISYARYFNKRNNRTGGLWDGRYHSFVVGSDRYFLDCSRYIEMNPVRARMTDQPGEYVRSSFLHNAQGVVDPIVTTHLLYEELGQSAIERRVAYQALFRHHLDEDVCNAIRKATKTGEPLGGESAPE